MGSNDIQVNYLTNTMNPKNSLRFVALLVTFLMLSPLSALAYSNGDRVQCNSNGVNVRRTTDTSSGTNIIGPINSGDLGTYSSGPYSGISNTYSWYLIKWDKFSEYGYTASQFVNAAVSAPVISSISPNPLTYGSTADTITINGSNFVSGCTVTLKDLTNGGTYAKSVTYVSSSQIKVTANFTNNTATWSAQVTSPTASNTVQFQVNAAVSAPVISSISPNPLTYGSTADTITINGSNFVSGCTVTLKDLTNGGTYAKSVTYVSSSQIKVTANFTNNTATWSAQVTSPTASNTVQFQVNAAVSAPVISSISPNPLTYGSTADTITINGSNFVSGCTVTLKDLTNGGTYAKSVTYVSSSQIKVTANFTNNTATWSAQVTSPTASNTVQFQVNAAVSAPVISSISPNPLTYGSTADTITINGSNFVSGCTVTLKDLTNGGTYAKSVTYVSSSQIKVTANFTNNTATWSAQVTSPTASNTVQFQVNAAVSAPVISSISPNPLTYGSTADTITINGSNFVSGCTVTLKDLTNGGTYAKSVTYVSSSQIKVTANFTNNTATWSAQVTSPTASNTVQFQVNAAVSAPVISSISPNPLTYGSTADTITINGSNFVSGCTVTLKDLTNGGTYAKSVTYVSSSQIKVTANFTNNTATWSAQVTSPTASNTVQFQVNAAVSAPVISSISPNPLTYGSTADTITINGSNFVSGCTVTLKDLTNGGTYAKSVTYVSSSQIKVTANFTNNTATWSAQVTSPTASNTVQFQVNAAVSAPVISSISPNPLTYGSTADTITINGSNFVSGCTVTLKDLTNGGTYAKSVTYVSSSQIKVTANFTNNTATWSAQVTSPTASNTVQFQVNAAVSAPVISSISPNPLTYGSTADTITINGSNFVSGCTVTLKDLTNGGTYAKSVTYVSSSQIKVTANFTNNTATWSAQVTSPTASNTVQFQVNAAVSAPVISSISPNPLTYGSTADTITINGSNFVSGCTVTLKDLTNGGTYAKSVTYVSSSQIKVTANFTNNTATWSAQVTSPTASNTVQFQVNAAVSAPVITVTSPNGGQSWAAGSTHSVTWNTAQGASLVSYYLLTYSTQSGAAGTFTNMIWTANASAQSFSWTSPSTLSSTHVRVKVEAFNVNNLSIGSAVSASDFTISASAPTTPTVSVTSPVSGDAWTAGTTRAMQWAVSDPSSQISYFIPEYSFNGSTFTSLSAVGSSVRQANITIPSGTSSSQARVKVTAYNSSGTALATATGSAFSIALPAETFPTARIDANNLNPDWGQSVSFTGSQSRDSSGGTNLTYLWSFGDGGTSSAANPSYAFAGSGSPRSYTVKLTVTEPSSGKTASATLSLLVGSTKTMGANTTQSQSKDPVNLATGNYSYEHVDLRLPGRGLPFEFKRFYNSKGRIEANAPFGPRWTHSYQLRLVSGTDGKMTLYRGDGNTEAYEPQKAGYKPEPGVHNMLLKNADTTFSLISKEQVRHDFNAQGRLASITDRNGNTIMLHYTSGGLLDTITDTVGRVIAINSDGSGRITKITDPLNHSVTFAYDTNSDLVTATDRRGKATQFTYDADHQITAATDPNGNKFVRNVYDAMNRVVSSQKDALNGETKFEYDFVSHITTVTDALGYKSWHRHDDRLRVVAVTDPLGYTERYEYDADNNRTKVTDKRGASTFYAYDKNGNVTAKVDALNYKTAIKYDLKNNPLSRSDASGKTTSFAYDLRGNLVKMTDPASAVTLYEYDATGQLVRTIDPLLHETKRTYDPQGNLAKVTDALNGVTEYTYDAAGRRLTQKDALNNTTTSTYNEEDHLLTTKDALNNVVTNTYDNNGNRITATDARNNTTTFTYDAKDRLTKTVNALSGTTQHTYDALDRKISTTDPLLHTTSWTYDALGRMLTAKDAKNNITTFTYDPNGNQTSVTDALGRMRWAWHDPLNRPVLAGDALGNVVRTDYDALGRKVKTTDANGHATSFAYDVAGRLVRVVDAAGGKVGFTYDKAGNRRTMTDSKGYTTRYAYDELNRRIGMLEPMGGLTAFAYDAVGNRLGILEPNNKSTIFFYDEVNRLVLIGYDDNSSVTFTYDANGNRTGMTDSIGTSSWQYDALNRMTSQTDAFGKVISYGYDAAGNRRSLTYPGSKVVAYTYDELNRLVSVKDWLNRTTSYTYDAAGNPFGATNPNGTSAIYGYDDAGRLTSILNSGTGGLVIASYDIQLDPVGNHLRVDQQEPLEVSPPQETVNYTYDKDHRMLKANSTLFTYDANGNPASRGSDTFTFDARNRLASAQISGTASAYRYDGLGNRVERVIGSGTTRYVQDLNGPLSRILAETDGAGTVTAYYLHGLGLVSRIAASGSTSWYHCDSRGSTVALTGSNGVVTDKYAYDTFGKLLGSEGTTTNPFRYLGRHAVVDDGDGLLQIRARYYAPEYGRFLSKDPKPGQDGQTQSFNRYSYALNNPIRLVDVSGLSARESSQSAVNSRLTSTDPTINHEAMLQGLSADAISVLKTTFSDPWLYVNTGKDMLEALAKYFAGGGGGGLPTNFSIFTQEVTNPRLPLYHSTLANLGSKLDDLNAFPILGAGVNALQSVVKTSGSGMNWEERAARASLSVSFGAIAGMTGNPYAEAVVGTILDTAEDYTYDHIIAPSGAALNDYIAEPAGKVGGELLFNAFHGTVVGNFFGF